MGYAAGVAAYRRAAAELTPEDLSEHYVRGLAFFRERFVPALKTLLEGLSGGAWSLGDYEAYAAGSDVDLMGHLVEAVAARAAVRLYPGDWHGFRVGSTHGDRIRWDAAGPAELSCLCVPSVRNGHFTDAMADFVAGTPASLLNLNLFPTLAADERRAVAQALAPALPRAVLSISFSRGFGLTASQLGVALVHRDHPYRARYATQWDWYTYFHNALAARAFLALDPAGLAAVDDARRAWVRAWLTERGLPALATGSYYVRAFRVDGPLPPHLAPLVRDDVVRLCFKPPLG